MRFVKNLVRQREFTIVAVIITICIVMSFVSPIFMTFGNIKALLMGVATTGLIGVSMCILMVSGGIDMSVGSVMGFSAVITGMMLKAHCPIILSILTGLAVGASIGLLNGFIVCKVGISAFITTLAGLNMYRGLTYVITHGFHQSDLGARFNMIGQSTLFGIQLPVYYCIIYVIIGDILLRRSRFFRQSYYVGSNVQAARVSGINTDLVLMFNYAMTGFSAALAGIIYASRSGSASVTAGQGMEVKVITAVIIGGASMAGGEGSVIGAFFGAFLTSLIMNVLTLLSIDVNWQQFVVGATLLIAVMIDTLNNKRRMNQIRKQSRRARVD